MTSLDDITFNRVGLWSVSFISQNEHEPVRVNISVVGGTVEQAVAAARKIITTVPLLYPASEYMLFEAAAINGGVFIPMSADLLDKKNAPDTTKGAEGKVLKMVPKPN